MIPTMFDAAFGFGFLRALGRQRLWPDCWQCLFEQLCICHWAGNLHVLELDLFQLETRGQLNLGPLGTDRPWQEEPDDQQYREENSKLFSRPNWEKLNTFYGVLRSRLPLFVV